MEIREYREGVRGLCGWAFFLHGLNGDVALAEASPHAYKDKGRFTPPEQPKHKQVEQFPEQAFAYPVIANGVLYIRDLGTLWAYDIKANR